MRRIAVAGVTCLCKAVCAGAQSTGSGRSDKSMKVKVVVTVRRRSLSDSWLASDAMTVASALTHSPTPKP